MQNINSQAYLIDTLKHTSITLSEGRSYNDQIGEVCTRFANIAMGLAWFNRMNVLQARHYTSYSITTVMVFLGIPQSQHASLSRYVVDSVTGIYYFANGELRVRPTIYAEEVFREARP